MRKLSCLAGLFIASLFSPQADSRPDQFTPLVASALTANTRPFPGTDGRTHIVYELVLTDTSATAATLKKIEVVDESNPSKALATYEGQELLSRLRTTGSTAAESPTIEFNSTSLFLIDLTLDAATPIPARLLHHIDVLAASAPDHTPTTPVPLSYTVAPVNISRKLPEIAAPLSGNGWVAFNGCCGVHGVHRSTSLTVNGGIYFAQRFAIDWMRLDDAGRLVHGDPADVHNYPDYGADVLAVADGKVVDTLNTLDDQKPGTLPDRKTITLENVDGNHVVLDLGDGVFAFYAHMQKGSVKVVPGDQVKRGQVLGKLGNTGNTSAPHLHFHLMDGVSVLGSNGISYVVSSFALAGRVPEAQFAAASGIEGVWNQGLLATPNQRERQYPMDLEIVNFPPAN